LIASNGLVLENNRTLPYGELWSPQVSSATTNKFTTYQRDSESGLDYAINRYVANTYGRFASKDQGGATLSRPASLNRYIYSLNDPINRADPDGNISDCYPRTIVNGTVYCGGIVAPDPNTFTNGNGCEEFAPGGCSGGDTGGGPTVSTNPCAFSNLSAGQQGWFHRIYGIVSMQISNRCSSISLRTHKRLVSI